MEEKLKETIKTFTKNNTVKKALDEMIGAINAFYKDDERLTDENKEFIDGLKEDGKDVIGLVEGPDEYISDYQEKTINSFLETVFNTLNDEDKKEFVKYFEGDNVYIADHKIILNKLKFYEDYQKALNAGEPSSGTPSTDASENDEELDNAPSTPGDDSAPEPVVENSEPAPTSAEEVLIDKGLENPAIKAYIEETNRLKGELTNKKAQLELYNNFKTRINETADVSEIQRIVEEINNAEFTDARLKEYLIMFANKKMGITTKIDTKYYNALLTKIETASEEEKQTLIQTKVEYDYIKLLIDNKMLSAEEIKNRIESSKLDETFKGELNTILESTYTIEVNYDDVFDEAERDINQEINDMNSDIENRENYINEYIRIISLKTKAERITAFNELETKFESFPDELKTELSVLVKTDMRTNEAKDYFEGVSKIEPLEENQNKYNYGSMIPPTEESEELVEGFKLDRNKNSQLIAYINETNKLKEKRDSLKGQYDKYNEIKKRVINATTIEELEAIKNEVGELGEEFREEFREAINKVIADKTTKFSANSENVFEYGEAYKALKESNVENKEIMLVSYEKHIKNMKILSTADTGYLSHYRETITNDTTITMDIKRELISKIDILINRRTSVIFDDKAIIDEYTRDITALEADISVREKNIEIYKRVLEKIRALRIKIQNGKTIEDEDVKKDIADIDKDISTVTDEKLRDELTKLKEEALRKKKIIVDKKDGKENLWKWLNRIGGLVAGAVAGYLITNPLVITGIGLALGIGGAVSKLVKDSTDKKIKETERKIYENKEISGIETPSPELVEQLNKLNKRGKIWDKVLNGCIWAGMGLAAGRFIRLLTPGGNPIPVNKTTGYDQIKIGDKVGQFNVSQGHDTAAWAVNGQNVEALNGQYVNSDSVFQSFRVINPDGSLGQAITTPGMSIQDAANSLGVDPSRIAVNVARGDAIIPGMPSSATSQAWISPDELLTKVGP